MKPYTIHVDIELPRERVVELFDSSDSLFQWQTGLKKFEHLSGEPGQVGAKSKMIFQMGKREIEIIETITRRDFPGRFDGHYEWGAGENTLENRFIQLGGNTTRWESTCSYKFRTLMLKLMGWIMPGSFRSQNQAFMDNFKEFCENGTSV